MLNKIAGNDEGIYMLSTINYLRNECLKGNSCQLL